MAVGNFEVGRRTSQMFAAVASVCAPTDRVMLANIQNYKDMNLKIYHGGMDDVVLPENAFNFWMKFTN